MKKVPVRLDKKMKKKKMWQGNGSDMHQDGRWVKGECGNVA